MNGSFIWYQNLGSRLFRSVCVWQTDGQTDFYRKTVRMYSQSHGAHGTEQQWSTMTRERHDLRLRTEIRWIWKQSSIVLVETRMRRVKVMLQMLVCFSRLPCSPSTETSAAATSVTYLTSTASSSPPAAIHTHGSDVRPACAASSIDSDRYMQHRKQLWAASGKTLQLQVWPWCVAAL